MLTRRVLIVDDEPGMLEICQEILEELGEVSIATCSRATQALDQIRENGVDLLVTDIRMPGMNGVELLEAARKEDPNVPVLLLTAYPTVETAVEALRLGASDYLIKPFHPDQLLEVSRRLLENLRLRSEHRLLARQLGREFMFGEMVGKSAKMAAVFHLIDRAAKTDAPVLIVGETGTGKELVARALYRGSPRAQKKFVPIDCASIPENLIESEFFGHEKGAFTGANEKRIGLVEYADGGTLFLDEIGELPSPLQAKFLRALQEKMIRRVGGKREFPIDIRILAATNRPIEEEVKAGQFREDLYYRLNVLRIDMPPLRERKDDIPLLVSHFLGKLSGEIGNQIKEIDPEALEVLVAYDWPGNVRELQNILKRAMALVRGDVVTVDDLPEALVLSAGSRSGSSPSGYFEMRRKCTRKFERDYLENVLIQNDGNVSQAAIQAGLPRGTLYRLLKRHGIKPATFRRRSESGGPDSDQNS